MTGMEDFLTNLAASLAYDLLKAAGARIRTMARGAPAQQALHCCYQSAFEAMLSQITADLDTDHQALVKDILRRFVAQPQVAETLLDLALTGAPTPDLPSLRRAFDALDFDRATLPVDFDQALTAFHRGLTDALLEEASQPDSPLFNQVNLGRVLAVQALLVAQHHTLDEIARRLAKLESAGQTVYNIIIQQATGVAIGDQARVEQGIPPEVQALLHEILVVLRGLRREPSPADTTDLLLPYLDWLIRQHSTLELRGIRHAGHSPTVPLERVYVALQAEPVAASEWQESRRLLEDEFNEWLERSGLDALDEVEKRRYRWRFLAGHPLMPALEERDRPHIFGERKPQTLNLAEAVRRYRWLVILGDPGSGKTTLARWLTLQLARALRDGEARVQVPAHHVDPKANENADPVDLGPARLPVLVRVADYAEARRAAAQNGRQPPSLLDFLGHQGWQGEFPTFPRGHERQGERIPPDGLNRLVRDFLRRGRALIILDGLDEITAADDRAEIVRAVESFIRDWVTDPTGLSPFDQPDRPWHAWTTVPPAESGGNQIVITSRIAGYHASPLSGRLTHVTIQPMTDPAVDRFCEAWTLAVHQLLADPDESDRAIAKRAEREAKALKATLHDPNRPGLRELAGNPLLLTILAMVHHSSQARLPEQRVRLYQIAVKNLVEVWRDSGLTEDEVVQVLAPVAAHIHQHSPTGLIEEEELRAWVTRGLAAYRGEDPERPTPAFRRDVAAFLNAVRERVGLLAARGERFYGFLHLTFQEYLAARHLAGDPATAVD